MATTTFNDRRTTQFKVILEPSLPHRQIIVRSDSKKIEGLDEAKVAEQVGNPPVIRVDDYLVNNQDIVSLRMEIGESFFPTIALTFKDIPERFKKIATAKKTFMSIFYGNVKDAYYIKQEYLITSLHISPLSPEITVYGQLWIPEWYIQNVRYFGPDNDADTSFKCIKKLCEEMHLGIWTNLDDTTDSQNWLQDNCTNGEFMMRVISHSFKAENTKVLYFIDQYDYLNIIDVTKAIENREKEIVEIHPDSGQELEKPREVILSSKLYDEDDKLPERERVLFEIASWTPSYNYGENAENLPLNILRNELSLSDKTYNLVSIQLQTKTDLFDNLWYVSPIWEDVHKNYMSTKNEEFLSKMHYEQGDTLICEMAYPCMFLYPWMYVPVKIYYKKERSMYDDQNSTTPPEELVSEAPPIQSQDEINDQEREDELHSGDYVITSIIYEFSPSPDGSFDASVQTVKVHRPQLDTISQVKNF